MVEHRAPIDIKVVAAASELAKLAGALLDIDVVVGDVVVTSVRTVVPVEVASRAVRRVVVLLVLVVNVLGDGGLELLDVGLLLRVAVTVVDVLDARGGKAVLVLDAVESRLATVIVSRGGGARGRAGRLLLLRSTLLSLGGEEDEVLKVKVAATVAEELVRSGGRVVVGGAGLASLLATAVLVPVEFGEAGALVEHHDNDVLAVEVLGGRAGAEGWEGELGLAKGSRVDRVLGRDLLEGRWSLGLGPEPAQRGKETRGTCELVDVVLRISLLTHQALMAAWLRSTAMIVGWLFMFLGTEVASGLPLWSR